MKLRILRWLETFEIWLSSMTLTIAITNTEIGVKLRRNYTARKRAVIGQNF